MSATPTVYAGTIDWLQEKMELTDEDLEEINDLYDEPMLTATTDLADSVDKAVQAAIIDSTKAGESVTNAIKRLRQVFVDEGLTEQAPYRLEAVYRTSVQQGYAAGRWRAMNSDAIRPHIKGLTYHAVEDDRTTPLCEQLDGTTLPMDDPFWETYNPPNHWNCRSTVLEIFDDQEMEIVEPDEDIDDPQEGFGVNFGEVLTTETA
jgi:SPP1 gp7 family putative phage head morphogenesis protein